MSDNKFVLNLIRNINKQNPKEVSESLIVAVQDGEFDVLEVYATLKRMEKIVETTIGKDGNKRLKEYALDEVRKYSKDGVPCKVHGATFVATSVHTYYDFKACEDPYWLALDEAEAKLKVLKKAREESLKTIPAIEPGKLTRGFRTEILETMYALEEFDSGEEVTLFAPVKKQREGVKTTIK